MASRCYFIATGGSGAISSHFKELSNTLAKRGNRVIILIGYHRKDLESHGTNPAVYIWPSQRPVRLRDAIFLFKLVRSLKPDCLIGNFGSVNIMMVVGWLTRVSQRVCWYHTVSRAIDLEFEYFKMSLAKLKLQRLRKRLVYRLATNIVAVSEAALNDLCQVYCIEKDKCSVFYNSLQDPEPLHIIDNLASQSRNLTCVGNLSFIKGQDILIRAITQLRNDSLNFSLKFIGDGPTKNYLYNLVSDMRLADKCFFAGHRSHKEVLQILASSYASIVPSRIDNLPTTVIESMAVGTPVIATNVGGIPEMVRDGVEGFLVPPESPEKIAEKLLLLLKNPDLRETMAKNARQRFLEKFEQRNGVLRQAIWLEGLLQGSN
jgi:glycosyltransferase involved in cell wall biosynthesis